MISRPRCPAALAALLTLTAACAGTDGMCELPAAAGAPREVDATAEFTLPDSGGFVANGQGVARERVGAFLRDVFAPRPPDARVVFVWRPSRARCADVAFLAAEARRAGGAAYDALGSGRLPLDAGEPPDER